MRSISLPTLHLRLLRAQLGQRHGRFEILAHGCLERAFELGLRYSAFNGSDFTTANAAGTGVLSSATAASNQATAWTFQAKWIVNPNVRFILDYVDTEFGNPVRFATGNVTTEHERALTMRAALDF